MLRATGPVVVDGITLTSADVVDELLNRAYLRLSTPRRQDAFFEHVARKVFDLIASGAGSPQRLVQALARGAQEGRLLIHSFDDREQRELVGTPLSGEFPRKATANPQVGLYFNDATGSKMSYFLDYDAQVSASSCLAGRQQLSGHLRIGSHPPADQGSLPTSVTGGAVHGVPAGSQLVVADVYGPVGGTLGSFTLDGRRLPGPVNHYFGRPVSSVALFLDPGQSLHLSWRMTTGPGQTGDIDVRVTPGVRPGNRSSVAMSGCRG